MSYLITTRNELEGLSRLLRLVLGNGRVNGNYLEILSCLLTIHYEQDGLVRFRAFHDKFLDITGQIGREGWNKATRVYTTNKDRVTKPSYLRRLLEYPDTSRKSENSTQYISQIDTISSEMAKKPGYSILSFVFLRPADLVDKFRPGYVPCPLAGDFKFRDGRLHLGVMFRTSDAFGVGYADIFYLRAMQETVLQKAKEKSSLERIHAGEIGDLNLYFSRTYIERSHQLKDPMTNIQKSVSICPLAKKLAEELRKATDQSKAV